MWETLLFISKTEQLSPPQSTESYACNTMSLKTASKDINPVYLAVNIFEFEGDHDWAKRVELFDISERWAFFSIFKFFNRVFSGVTWFFSYQILFPDWRTPLLLTVSWWLLPFASVSSSWSCWWPSATRWSRRKEE